ncbi:MAG: hypothetical protein OXD40_15710 [bacterium]|nr:hypothetical protein [bacterium]
MMPRFILIEARAKALSDGKRKGFGVRVLPSGAKRCIVHYQHRGQRVLKIVGDTLALADRKWVPTSVPLFSQVRHILKSLNFSLL